MKQLLTELFENHYKDVYAYLYSLCHDASLSEDLAAEEVPEYAILYDELVLDRIYDPGELGARGGHLVIYVYSDVLTVEAAAGVLVGIRGEFDKAGVPFRAISLTLRHPKTEDGPWDEEYIGVEHFPYDDIYTDGMAERVKAADEALKAQRAEQDKQKQ